MTRIYLLLVITLVVVAGSPYLRKETSAGSLYIRKDTSHCCRVGDWDSCNCFNSGMSGICIDKRCYGCRRGCKTKQK